VSTVGEIEERVGISKTAPNKMKTLTRSAGWVPIGEQSILIRDERATLVRMTVGDLIRLHRTDVQARLTQEELAFRSGISFEHLNRVENYRAGVSIEVLDRIALAFGFDRLSEFLGRDLKGIL